MSYIPHTASDKQQMLQTVGLNSVQELFDVIPAAYRYPKVDIAEGVSEQEVLQQLKSLAKKNDTTDDTLWFLGAGIYRHYSPAIVDSILSRGEFLTTYTPYQPEVSQGTLQAIFEFQSMVAEIFDMEVVNASHYDGATAMAEAAIMGLKNSKRNKIILDGVHPHSKEVVASYLVGTEGVLYDGELNEETACYIVAYPSFTGDLKDLKALGAKVHAMGALFVVHADPLCASLFTPPGEAQADIVTGEGQSLGLASYFGGATLGLFAVTKKLIRKMPGRVIGQTSDPSGREGCVLTFAAREQHIRRDKATSNICSNQGLMALAASIYMASMGKNGLRDVAKLCYEKACYAAAEIAQIPSCTLINEGLFFREFVIDVGQNAEDVVSRLKTQHDITAGLALGQYFPDKQHQILICVTEINTKAEIDSLVVALKEVLA